ncbi:cysteine synthase CysM [Glaciecola sp. HTCC2999]|jgi:cysteine synthase B|uniref:cysteine synthase CysM n=1 Tax=Glaciecola sp. HTCC2999 TaxID=455436 RepID=UPI0000E0E65D|nr:cysteine synthase CysM [Glaciecola sp. HTCC2999]
MTYPTIDQIIGNTPLVRLQRLAPESAQVLVKLEGHNPASSVKDRAALYMINEAESAGHIMPGDTLIEATSGNTGIALAMVAAIRGYRMRLIMPDNLSVERRAAMKAYGAELILVDNGMEGARDLAHDMEARGEGKILNQFANSNNPLAHFSGTGPEIWRDTHGEVTHFVSAMGTTGTIMGTSKYLKAQNPDVQIVGLQPSEGSQIAGIRRWPEAYLPSIYEPERVDEILDITQAEAEDMTRRLAAEEGIFCGASAGGAVVGALKVAEANPGSVVVTIICDRGDRYLSTGIFPG